MPTKRFFECCLDFKLLTKIKFFQKNSRCKQNKENPEHTFVDINK